MNRNIIGSSLLFFILAAALPLQAQVYVIENATIVPVTSPEIAKGHLVIEDGKIRDFGPRVDRPRSAQRIDATGKFVYPGMIDVNTSLGLADISGIWQTTDNTETAEYSPYLRASQGMNPINRQINVQRFTGVTSAIAVPRGGVISGQEILINLDGWSVEDLTVKDPVAISMVFPTAASANRGRRRAAAQQQGGDPIARAEKQLQDIRELLRKTRNYVKAKEDFEAKKRQTPPPFDMVLVHLVPIVKREIPMTITVNGVEDIRKAMKFVKEENIRAVFVGVSDAYKIADEIAASGIPIVYSQTLQTPGMQEPYDLYYTIPAVLHRAGVTFAFNISSHSNVRNLPFLAGMAVPYGLPKEEAVKAVTIIPARMYGVDDVLGSIEKGKMANLVVTDGHLLEPKTHVTELFIRGKKVDLTAGDDYKLYEKFRKRPVVKK